MIAPATCPYIYTPTTRRLRTVKWRGAPMRLANVCVALSLAVSAAGCSSTSVANVPQDAKAVLQVWIRQPANSPAAKTAERLVAEFTRTTGVRAKLVALYEDFETKVQQQAAQRQLPDIIINDTAQLGTMQTQGWIQEVNPATFAGAASISDRAWKATLASNGKNYAVPFSAQSFAVFVRADWWSRAPPSVATCRGTSRLTCGPTAATSSPRTGRGGGSRPSTTTSRSRPWPGSRTCSAGTRWSTPTR